MYVNICNYFLFLYFRLLLLGISSNVNVNQLRLDLSGNELRFSPPYEIDVIIGHMTNLISLDISNNSKSIYNLSHNLPVLCLTHVW